MAKAAIGDLWACIMLTAVRVTVSNIMMLPTEDDGAGGGCVDNGEVVEGVGAGYAKNAFSLDGDSAQMAGLHNPKPVSICVTIQRSGDTCRWDSHQYRAYAGASWWKCRIYISRVPAPLPVSSDSFEQLGLLLETVTRILLIDAIDNL